MVSGGKPRLLLVDDDPRARRAAGRVFSSFFEVTQAASANEALAHIDRAHVERTHGFDVVLTDLEMPDGDGIELLASLAARDTALLRRALVWTGFELDESEVQVYASHGIAVLSKSLPTAEIARLLLARATA